ncbi:hypothetical protein A2160_00170 [Candidatus Beckwithbacteria bacterium RBG_13_42_9]|uniref:Pyrrolidone-carboxylate peptidase n=1 Tax=Candidatus Beckwithbacteria bacterium RBG_13_42_9 TaxID=1797457 RepID=A0A1F5E531_9BACT|nr:MAG: hypothetical protein A2160_00170 [Candidatus Beckwithbacteria bacterium RBG_13_42_9]
MKKILIYGFDPYQGFKENISAEIVRKIPGRNNLTKVIFPVKFNAHIFRQKIKEIDPNIIIGLGQRPRSRKIRIERKAQNLFGVKAEKPKIILKNHPKYLILNLKLNADKNSYISYKTGRYVCNFSMYVISHFCQNKNIKFSFLHIPQKYHLAKAVKFIEEKIKEIGLKTNDDSSY